MPVAGSHTVRKRCDAMDLIWTVAILLAVLWLLGMIASYTIGGFIHILLVVAVIVVLIRLIQGRRQRP